MHDYLIDEITTLRHENRLLREEVEARRAAAADLMRAISVPVVEPCRIEQLRPHGSSSQGQSRSASTEAGTSETDRIESAISLLVDQLARTTAVMTPLDIDPLVDQIDNLNDELAGLREEIRTLHRRQTMSLLSVRDSREDQTGPRVQPLRTNSPDIIIESTASASLWRRLKQPWFYLPLVWGTLGIIAVLMLLLVFFD